MPERAPDGRPDLLAGQSLPPPPRQERSRLKRAALLAAALDLFAAHGYEATSIDEIARQAGVAVGGFYQHFASKQQVLLVLMDQLLAEAAALTTLGEGAASVAPPRAVIAGLVRQALRVDWAYAGAYRAWREAASRDAAVRILYGEIEAWTAHQLELLLRMFLGTPGGRPAVDVSTLSWVLGTLFWRLAETPLDEPDAVIAAVTDLIYHALFIDSDEK